MSGHYNINMLEIFQHPLFITSFVLIIAWLWQRISRKSPAWPKRLLWGGVALATILYAGLAIAYLVKPGYWDHIEPSVTVIGQQVLAQRQIYHSVDAPQRFSLLYGPTAYLSNALFL